MPSLDPEKILQKLRTTVSALEKTRGSRIFCLIHCRGGHICEPSTLWPVIKSRAEVRQGDVLELLLHSPGGSPDIAFRLMKFFRRRYKKVNALVPLKAKSAATLMCLGSDQIFMGEFAELGPVDIQIVDPIYRGAESFSPLDEFKSLEFMRDYAVEVLDFFTGLFLERSGMSVKEAMHESIPCITGMMRPLYEQVDPLEMGEHRRSMAIGEEYATRLLALTRNPNAAKIVEKLVWEYPSHNFAVDFDEARLLNLPVERMNGAQENALLDLLTELNPYDISFCGFIPPIPAKAKHPGVKSPQRKRPRSMPARPQSPAAVA